MKKTLLAVAAACLMAAPAFSATQQNSNVKNTNVPETHTRVVRGERVENGVRFLTTVLSLTNSQQQQATMIFNNVATANAPILANIKAEREKLSTAIRNNETPAAIQAISTAMGSHVGQLIGSSSLAYEQFYKTLTPEQQTKMNQLHNELHGRMAFWMYAFEPNGAARD